MSADYQVEWFSFGISRTAPQLHPDDTLLFLVSGDSVIPRNRPASFADAMRGLHEEIRPADRVRTHFIRVKH
jgi:hypothetical protein